MLRPYLNCQDSTMGQEAEEGRASVCKMRRGLGVPRQNGSFVEETWVGWVLGLYIHTHGSSVPFPETSMHPLFYKVPQHSGPPSIHSSISKIRNLPSTSYSTSINSVHESVQEKSGKNNCWLFTLCNSCAVQWNAFQSNIFHHYNQLFPGQVSFFLSLYLCVFH